MPEADTVRVFDLATLSAAGMAHGEPLSAVESLSLHVKALDLMSHGISAALGTWATNQNTRVTDEQARAASEHATKLGATSAARTQLIADMAAKDTAVTDHTADVTAALSAARTASSDAMTALGDDMTASQNAINTDYARVQTAHESQTAVSEAMLAREMAAWQSTHDDTVAEIARLKAAP